MPTWLATLSIVTSMMMIIPVVAVAVNHHMTVLPRWRMVLISPTLRFVVAGAIMYTLASVQGSIEALRTVNTITHFTHYTVAHAHMGLYGFMSFILFGSMYFILPRLVGWEWPYAWAISLHFWLVFVGFAIYFVSLTIGGWLQGLAMLDAAVPFMESMALTVPYLTARSVGGTLMTLGHFDLRDPLLHGAAARLGPRRELPPEFALGRFVGGRAVGVQGARSEVAARCRPGPGHGLGAHGHDPRSRHHRRRDADPPVRHAAARGHAHRSRCAPARSAPEALEPYTESELAGRQHYISLGCIYCHSQQPQRPLPGPGHGARLGTSLGALGLRLRRAAPPGHHEDPGRTC